jgi:hypothetical protein
MPVRYLTGFSRKPTHCRCTLRHGADWVVLADQTPWTRLRPELIGENRMDRFSQAVTEAANRAEATALLIRCGYRVYRPEADIEGEDPVLRLQSGALHGVQLKSRPLVD